VALVVMAFIGKRVPESEPGFVIPTGAKRGERMAVFPAATRNLS